MPARKTEAEKRLAGTYKPSRSLSFPVGTGVGPPPDRLESELKAVWQELALDVPEGVGSLHDRHAFELLVRLLAKIHAGRFKAADSMQAKALLSAFAMTPDSPRRAALANVDDPHSGPNSMHAKLLSVK